MVPNDKYASGYERTQMDSLSVEEICSRGDAYYFGVDIPQDYKLAAYWYELGAIKGHALSQSYLAWQYFNGYGVEKDYCRAAELWHAAARQGLPRAQMNLGRCYEQGVGVEMDVEQAVHWYERSADGGDSMGQMHLGRCYLKGKGVEKNQNLAVSWLEKAANAGEADACHDLSMYYFTKDDGEHLTDEQIALATYWANKKVEYGGNTNSLQNYLIAEQMLADDTIEDKSKALEYLWHAADRNFALALTRLARCYQTGRFLPKDTDKAIELFQKAAQLGSKAAKFALMVYEKQSEQVSKNDEAE